MAFVINGEFSHACKYLVLWFYVIRGHKVVLGKDLAMLYDVETFNLNKAVKRNIERFPEDFMFQLTDEVRESLTSQIGISKKGRGGRRYDPYVFTEHRL